MARYRVAATLLTIVGISALLSVTYGSAYAYALCPSHWLSVRGTCYAYSRSSLLLCAVLPLSLRCTVVLSTNSPTARSMRGFRVALECLVTAGPLAQRLLVLVSWCVPLRALSARILMHYLALTGIRLMLRTGKKRLVCTR